ncbi:MAG: transport system ATP-binding/permease protein [Actinomycetota bacterium]|nr:transport system ATP-binding/permease protein [Actinomycetota bacterium]
MGVPPIATELTWGLGPGDRVGILGPNGAGKTTLMRLVLDQQGPGAPLVDSGRVDRGSTVRPGALEQRLADVDTDARVLPWLRDVGEQVTVTTGEELTPSQLLEQFGFSDDTAWKRLGDLSGGELRRLFLLRLLLRGPNLVVLDEPTNDLDIDTLTVLEDVLDSWPGTLVVVSHDRYFLERVCDDIYLMADGALRHLPGGVDEYLAVLAGGGSGSTGGRAGADGGGAAASTSVADEGLSSTQERAIRKEIGGIERRVEKLEQQVVRLHDRMATHDQSDYSGLADLTAQLREVEAEVAALEERWFELSELLG